MLRDVFYYGKKPNVHPREKFAKDLSDARQQSTTEHFWIINEFCDYKGFDWDWDFEFLHDDDVWTGEHNNVWPSMHQKDSGTWLCNTDNVDALTVYRADVDKLKRKNEKFDHWVINHPIKDDFDFSWHHDPTDPPYIYVWGNQWFPGTVMPTVEYHVDGATELKHMDLFAPKLAPNKEKFEILEDIEDFDFSWVPDPTSPPYIYVWGNQWNSAENKASVRYVVDGATEFKYMQSRTTRKPNMERWTVPDKVDVSNFDFSWEPNPHDPPYIYQFGTQHQRTGAPIYTIPGATEIKYVDVITAIAPIDMTYWEVPDNLDIAEFDFSWHPDATDDPYIYVFGTQWAITGGPRYVVPGATQKKFIDTIIAKSAPSKKNWIIPDDIDVDAFDFSWHPYAEDEPFIYQFGTQWQKTGGPKYIVPGADETSFTKYIDTRIIKAKKLPSLKNWEIADGVEIAEFDYSWHHDETEDPYIYVFGNTQYRAEIMPTLRYVVDGATRNKFVSTIVAKLAPYTKGWKTLEDVAKFDYSWRPDPTDPPFIYVFGNKQYPGTIMPTVELHVEGATERKYVDDIVATLQPKRELFSNTELVKDFDYTWRPNPKDPPLIYQFGTQWAKTHGPTFTVAGATEIKYVDDIKATILPNMQYWEIPEGVDTTKFDFSWHPDALAPKYIYQFGTLVDDKDGPRYVMPDNNGEVVYIERTEINIEDIQFPRYYITTTLQDLIDDHSNEIFWALRENINYDNFNFGWVPDKENVYHINAFGSPDSESTQTYFVNGKMIQKGYTDINFIENIKLDEAYLATLFKPVSAFFVDRGNPETQERFEQLKLKFPSIQKTRFLNTWVDTINRCINRSSTELCWILNSELDYTDFDFNFYPSPWQQKMVHVFGTQWSHWGTTFMVNRDTFATDTKYVKIIEHLSNLNFVKNRRAKATNVLYDIIYIDHGNVDTSTLSGLVIKYEDSYLNTFRNMLAKLPNKKDHYVWVASTICEYDNFDFTYICDPFAREQLHVFPSDKQKFGDTFLINVNKLRELITDMEKLEDYEKISYNQHQRAKRLPAPTIITEDDTHVSTIHTDFDWPYATFVTKDNQEIESVYSEPMSVWAPEHKNIIVTSTGGTQIVVPREAKDHVKRELYDYPYIITNSRLAKSTPMDIVFLSNGETGAEENYEHLLRTTHGLANRVVRVDGVNGRVAAYHASAEASNTPWAFTVFAKLKVSAKFDWNWQPDRLQIPKHYVFHAKNPVNGLVYGHQAMIAYNKKLTLANQGKGLDFTMDDEHEVVEILSGVANFNTDEWSTWRTAFREALKLRANTDEVSKNRLEFWLTVGSGKFSQYSIDGATDAVQYYESVNGDFEKLKLSYDWPWLRAYFESRYK
jgi:hypothetical protein